MAGYKEYIDKANAWLALFQQRSIAYFKGCSEYELLAWGGNGLGLILIIVGIILV